MRVFQFILLFFLTNSLLLAQPVPFNWARQFGGASLDACNSTTVDNFGNVYSVGIFASTVDFDPGPGTFNLTSNGGSDIYICKLNALGNFIWVKQIGGSGSDNVRSITLDATGDLIVSGSFEATVDFDPGPGSFTMSPPSISIISNYCARYDANGNFIWARQFGTLDAVGIRSAIDTSGNILVIGSFTGTADFDPGPGVYTATANAQDGYVLKLSAAGNFLWAVFFSGSIATYNSAVTTDSAGTVYVGGRFSGTSDFDPGPGTSPLTSAGGLDGFICKLSSAGSFILAKLVVSSTGSFSNDGVNGLVIDGSGNLIACGGFNNVADFDPSSSTFTIISNGQEDVFISKLDSQGNLIWTKTFGDVGNDQVSDLMLGTSTIFSVGNFSQAPDFDPGVGVFNLNSAGMFDIFLLQLDLSGNFISANNIGGANSDYSIKITKDASGSLYLTGGFQSTVDFDPGPATFSFSSLGGYDAYVLKLSLCNDVPQNVTNSGNLGFCAGNSTTLNASASSAITWYTSPAGTTAIGSGTNFTTPSLAAGTYTYYAAAASCTASGTRMPFIITVSPFPTLSIVPSTATICAGQSVTLNASGAGSYTWLPSGLGPSVIILPASSTIYSLTGANNPGNCTASATSTINVTPLPVITITQPTLVCKGQPIIITAGGADSYAWSNGNQTASIAITPTASVLYTVTGTNSVTSCSASKIVSVEVLPCLTTDEFEKNGVRFIRTRLVQV
jgi:hypothetical protein